MKEDRFLIENEKGKAEMKQNLTTERGDFWCEKTQNLTLQISSELIGVLLWFNKFSAVLLKLVQ